MQSHCKRKWVQMLKKCKKKKPNTYILIEKRSNAFLKLSSVTQSHAQSEKFKTKQNYYATISLARFRNSKAPTQNQL